MRICQGQIWRDMPTHHALNVSQQNIHQIRSGYLIRYLKSRITIDEKIQKKSMNLILKLLMPTYKGYVCNMYA